MLKPSPDQSEQKIPCMQHMFMVNFHVRPTC